MITDMTSGKVRLLKPVEVAEIFRVDPRTVSRWGDQGAFGPGGMTRTPSGHRRFREDAVLALLNADQEDTSGQDVE